MRDIAQPTICDLSVSILEQFHAWMREATEREPDYPHAMTIATADAQGMPTARIVFLKEISAKGLQFFTNYRSRKGNSIAENPQASALFYWKSLARQIRFEGVVEQASPEDSDAYFASRPRGSQIGAWASLQSEAMTDRRELESRVAEFEAKFSGQTVPRPPHWGGFLLRPKYVEFWTDQPSRLHIRDVYRIVDGTWQKQLLHP